MKPRPYPVAILTGTAIGGTACGLFFPFAQTCLVACVQTARSEPPLPGSDFQARRDQRDRQRASVFTDKFSQGGVTVG